MKKTNPIIMKGLPVSKGIAIGKCHVEHGRKSIEENYIEKKLITRTIWFSCLITSVPPSLLFGEPSFLGGQLSRALAFQKTSLIRA